MIGGLLCSSKIWLILRTANRNAQYAINIAYRRAAKRLALTVIILAYLTKTVLELVCDINNCNSFPKCVILELSVFLLYSTLCFFKMSKVPIECCGTCQLLLRFGQARKILVLTCNALLSNKTQVSPLSRRIMLCAFMKTQVPDPSLLLQTRFVHEHSAQYLDL